MGGLAAAPRQLPTPDCCGALPPGARLRLVPVPRREGDSLRIFINYKTAAPGSAAPALRLTGWAACEAKEPQWREVRAARPYPGSDPQGPGAGAHGGRGRRPPRGRGNVLQVRLDQPALPTPCPPPTRTPPPRPGCASRPRTLARPFVLLDSAGLVLDRPYLNAGEGVAVAVFGLAQPVRWRRYPAGTPALPPSPTRAARWPPRAGWRCSTPSAAPAAPNQLLRLRATRPLRAEGGRRGRRGRAHGAAAGGAGQLSGPKHRARSH
ncbi:MAG: hypothetical protein WKG07_05805 [Hymenobacter sp.]